MLPSLVLLVWLQDLRHTGLSANTGAASPEHDLPAGSFVARVYYDNASDIRRLADYDLWEFNNAREKYVLLSMNQAIFDELAAQGWRVVPDYTVTRRTLQTLAPGAFNDGYLTVDELYAEMAAINATYPLLTELIDYGDSFCKTLGGCVVEPPPFAPTHPLPGYDLLAMRVTNEAVAGASIAGAGEIISGTKPILFLVANIHARELTTLELAIRLLRWLVTAYGVEADATWLLDWHEIWIVPTANPDGHWLVELGEKSPYNGVPFYQRKNGNRFDGCSFWTPEWYSQYGVDLNRNHSFQWSGAGASADPCSQNFRGSGPASEPEVTHLQSLISALLPDQRGTGNDAAPEETTGLFITLHSFSDMVLWPWGYTSLPAPNQAGLRAIGDKLATYNGYVSCQAAAPGCLYQASGTSDDWVYGELGVPAFTFEIGQLFMPPYSQIDAVQWPDNQPAFEYAAKIAGTPYLTVQGPDARAINVTIETTTTVTLTAIVDDQLNGGQAIAAASYSIDTPFWITGTQSFPMAPQDGQFDSVTEQVVANADFAGLGRGRHILYVRGQDSAGHWGPVSAIFVDNGKPYRTFLPVLFGN